MAWWQRLPLSWYRRCRRTPKTAVTYNAGNGYSFEKLSHPTVGTSQPDGIVDYQGNGAVAVPGADGNTANNEGDRGQSYTWAAASYGDWLYVGTCYAAMGNTLTLMNSTLGDSFDVEPCA